MSKNLTLGSGPTDNSETELEANLHNGGKVVSATQGAFRQELICPLVATQRRSPVRWQADPQQLMRTLRLTGVGQTDIQVESEA